LPESSMAFRESSERRGVGGLSDRSDTARQSVGLSDRWVGGWWL
jgi:hypothetical protein